jgi:hypothetical protein
MGFKIYFSSMQRLIIFSTIFFILSVRYVKYLFLKNIQLIINNGNYWDINSIFTIMFFIIGVLILVASVMGFIKIIKRIYLANKNIIVRERFAAFAWNCFWTFIISFCVAMILRVLIWP